MNKFIRHALPMLLALIPPALSALNVRDLKYDISDPAIVYPESTQADVHQLQNNWYLQNYTVMEQQSAPSAGDMSDETIIKNLQSIPTTIEMPFNSVVKNHIDLYVNRRRSLVETMLGMSLYYMPIFEEALEREGLPLELKYLPIIESALNPDAVSRAGATGLWQFMLATAKGLGMEVSTLVDERRDPIASSAMAAKYLKQLYNIYNDWGLAIAAYNCGPGNINKALARAGASAGNPKDFWQIYNYLPAETRGYLPGFIGATYAMTNYAKHGISPSLAKRPIITDTVHVKDRVHFNAISQVLDIPIDELRVLNPQYRQRIIPGDIKPYPLRLPSQLIYNYLMQEDEIIAESVKHLARSVVEVSQQGGGSGNGTTTEYRDVTKWHKVHRGETLKSIARKYGVSERQIRHWNGLKSSKVARGTSLKIVVREAVRKPKTSPAVEEAPAKSQGQVDVIYEDPETEDVSNVEIPEEVEAAVAVVVAAEPTKPDVKEEKPEKPIYNETPAKPKERTPAPVKVKSAASKEKTTPASKNKSKATAKTKSHKVAKGETLYGLSRRYGVSVESIKKANGLKSDALRLDQQLKIPAK